LLAQSGTVTFEPWGSGREASRNVELTFETQNLRRTCEDPDFADAQLGQEAAQEFIDRLADLRAAESLADVVVGRSRVISASEPAFGISIGSSNLLIAEVANRPIPQTTDGHVDCQKVWRLKLIAIEGTA
jgi:hypothetical protein